MCIYAYSSSMEFDYIPWFSIDLEGCSAEATFAFLPEEWLRNHFRLDGPWTATFSAHENALAQQKEWPKRLQKGFERPCARQLPRGGHPLWHQHHSEG